MLCWIDIGSRNISINGNTLTGHHCILNREYNSIGSMNRRKSGAHNDICIMAFEYKVLETGLPGTKGLYQPVRVDFKAIQEWAVDVMM